MGHTPTYASAKRKTGLRWDMHENKYALETKWDTTSIIYIEYRTQSSADIYGIIHGHLDSKFKIHHERKKILAQRRLGLKGHCFNRLQKCAVPTLVAIHSNDLPPAATQKIIEMADRSLLRVKQQEHLWVTSKSAYVLSQREEKSIHRYRRYIPSGWYGRSLRGVGQEPREVQRLGFRNYRLPGYRGTQTA